MTRTRKAVAGRVSSARKVIVRSALLLGAGALLCTAVVILFPGALLQGIVENRIAKSFEVSHPGYSIRVGRIHADVIHNRVSCDTVSVWSPDSSFFCRVDSLSVSGIRWLGLLLGSGFDPASLRGSVVETGDIAMAFRPSGYIFRCGPVRVSIPDSEIIAQRVDIRPSMSDEEFFGESRFRKTRIGFAAQRCRVSGMACVEAVRGENLRARSVHIEDGVVDILINKDKPPGKEDALPLMPGEILTSLKDTVGLDSVIFSGGRLRYGERMTTGGKPALLAFEGLQAEVTGIASHVVGGPNADVHARGTFTGGGTMDVRMSIPLSSAQCSFRYSGTLSRMGLRSFNSFIEISDNMRIKTGNLDSAAFGIDVRAGSATGNVRAVYTDLIIASINGRTGSEGGMIDRYASWIAKNVKIRGSNRPDRSGAMKIGTVKYARNTSDPFLGFAWFALRSGVGDVVGF
jgi:hypothetical protein